ncbi:unnamed protein product [Linum trigynum]|uniref:Uncharacterized protein n=1 Tax=Linum trigynum TaxID=586398 RepID=A0AAV2F4D8_9ROSI
MMVLFEIPLRTALMINGLGQLTSDHLAALDMPLPCAWRFHGDFRLPDLAMNFANYKSSEGEFVIENEWMPPQANT